jgi:hypothetical protein
MAYTEAQLAGFLRKCRAANRKKETAPIGASEANLKCKPKTLSAEQMERVDAVIQQQRIECEKGGWRASAKWLQENCEEYREQQATPMPGGEMASSDICPNSEGANQPQPLANTPESPQNAREALSAPSPIPLASAFWQALLYGSRDALVSPGDANSALRLVAHELSTHCNGADFIETLRADALRKALSERFGAKVWDVMNKLWRAAPASPDAPVANEDQSQFSPGVKDCPRSMPAWRREFHREVGNEQQLLEGIGGWCGG